MEKQAGMSMDALADALEHDLNEPREGGPGPRGDAEIMPVGTLVTSKTTDRMMLVVAEGARGQRQCSWDEFNPHHKGGLVTRRAEWFAIDDLIPAAQTSTASLEDDAKRDYRNQRSLEIQEESLRRNIDSSDHGTLYQRQYLRAVIAGTLLQGHIDVAADVSRSVIHSVIHGSVAWADAILAELERNEKPAEHGYCEVEDG